MYLLKLELDIVDAQAKLTEIGQGASNGNWHMFLGMKRAPQLRYNEEIFPFYQPFINSPPNTLSHFHLVVINTCAVEMPVTYR